MTASERIAFQNGFAVGFVKGGDTYISKTTQIGANSMFDVIEKSQSIETVELPLFEVVLKE